MPITDIEKLEVMEFTGDIDYIEKDRELQSIERLEREVIEDRVSNQ